MHVTLPNTPVPMFPLGRVFLFPQQLLPLHIFEPRYRRMVEDLLDSPGRLVMATIPDGEAETPEHAPRVLPVAGLGEIAHHKRLPDGRFMVWLMGLCRVLVTEVESARPYRRVQCEPFVETEVPAGEVDDLVRDLRTATTARLQEPLPLPDSAPPALLTDLLLQTLRAPSATIARAYAEPSIAVRARFVLDTARRTPPPEAE